MVRVFVRLSVRDFATWREAYHTLDDLQRDAGVVAHTLFREVDDANEVTIVADWGSIEDARTFGDHPKLRQTMMAGGVLQPPEIWYTEAVDG